MRVLALAGLLPLVACSLITGPDARTVNNAPPEVQSFVALLNQHREGSGCSALIWDARIADVARAHSDDMARNNYFAHTNLQGQSPFDRLHAEGVTFRAAAENIAWGQTTGQQVLQSWLNSPGHRTNIENCVYTKHGVGLVQNRWTHMFIGE